MSSARVGQEKYAWIPGSVFLVWVFFAALRQIDDPDYWTHLFVGRLYAQDWQRFLRDPALIFSDRIAEWPFQIMVYALESFGSHPLVCYATALLVTLILLPLVRRATVPLEPAKGLLLLLFLVGVVWVARFRFVPRPELLAYLLFSLALWLVYAWLERPDKAQLFGVLALLLCWRSVHASIYVGAPLLLAVAVVIPGRAGWERLWQQKTNRRSLLVALPIVGLLLYGVVRFLLTIIPFLGSGGLLSGVTEMRPTWEFPELFWPYLAVVIVAVVLAGLLPEGRYRRFFLLGLALVPGLLAARNVALSLIFMAFVAVEGARAWPLPAWLRSAQRALSILVLLVLFGSGVYMVRMPSPAWGAGVQWEYFPRRAATYVVQQHLPAPVFNNWDCGGYLNWQWQGAPAPFLDGRLGSKDLLDDHDRILEADGYEEILARRGFATLLIQPFYLNSGRLLPVVGRLLGDRRWSLVDASDALVFVRTAELNGRTPLTADAGWQLVLRQADRLGRLDSNMHHLEFTRGMALLALGRGEDARRAFHRGFAAAPELTDSYRMFKGL